jgi:hypothetical protein
VKVGTPAAAHASIFFFNIHTIFFFSNDDPAPLLLFPFPNTVVSLVGKGTTKLHNCSASV